MTSESTIEDTTIVLAARSVIRRIESLKNTEIDKAAFSEIKTQIRSLVDLCNTKPLKTFPVKIIDEPINKIEFGIGSTYYPELRFSEVPRFVIDSLLQAEKNMDDTRCLDALCVLRDYCNILVHSRFDCCLQLEPIVTGDE